MNNKLKRNRIVEKTMSIVFSICGFISVIFVILITVFLIISGIPAIEEIGIIKFLFGTVWKSASDAPQYGILPFILTSIYGTFSAILLGVPIGIFCAVYISKIADKKIKEILRLVVELLSGIPSVIYGLAGMIVIVPYVRKMFDLSDGANLFSAIIVLAIIVLPYIISVSETALNAVPKEYEEASLALGATKTETIFKVSIPAAKSGILTSVALGTGRALGESMAIMMVSGNVANMPTLFKSVRFLTTAVASEMSYASGLQRQSLFSIALVLFVFILIINLFLNILIRKKEH